MKVFSCIYLIFFTMLTMLSLYLLLKTQATPLKKPRGNTSLAGEISVSFKLPSDCDIKFEDVDKVVSFPR